MLFVLDKQIFEEITQALGLIARVWRTSRKDFFCCYRLFLEEASEVILVNVGTLDRFPAAFKKPKGTLYFSFGKY